MFTVIFAEKETLKLFEETKMFFGPLLDDEKVAFCEWDKNASTFDLMVPEIYDVIEYHKEWRALVLFDENREKINPFDYTDYAEPFYSNVKRNSEYYAKRRVGRFLSYEQAINNPLVKFTTALCKKPKFKNLIDDEETYNAILSGEMSVGEYMIKRQLSVLNCNEAAAKLEKYQPNTLKKFVKQEAESVLLELIRKADASGIAKLISDADIPEFIKAIGNDPIYYDTEYAECIIENTKKSILLNSIAENFSMKDKLPSEIICLSPRTFDFENFEEDVKWKKKDENSYSRFTDFNLYNEKLKFMLFDILPKDNKQYKFDQIKLMCLLLIMANNEMPRGLVTATHVYRAGIDFDTDMITKICEKYLGKLRATDILLKDIGRQLDMQNEPSVDDGTAQRLFESDYTVPVAINPSKKQIDLYAEYRDLGLSTDCPEDESVYWSRQYREINKRFVRYLREPRRAVKLAVTDGLHKNNKIEDDRTLVLSENQVEDVNFHLLEEEQKMVETNTTHLFETKKFTDQIQEADKNIKRGIAQRMTKKKTVFVGLIASLAYFVGFLPLIFTNVNTVKSFLFSFILTGVMIGLFMIVGVVYLLVLRKKLVNRFKHFNYVMSGICSNIERALSQFSIYLSSACNVMRDFSVLKKRESAVSRIKKVLAYHNMKIKEQTENVYEMFSKYVDFEKINIMECEPYDYDFTAMCDFEYEMPSIRSKKKIEYLQNGNEIIVPIDYVDAITLTREELYD